MPTIAQIHDVLQAIYGERLQLTGETEAALTAAEAWLGYALPKMLRDYYRLAAHSDWPNRCHNRLVRPDELQIRNGALQFFEENQWVSLWGVAEENMALPDPPVCAAWNNDEPLAWETDDASVSNFLIKMAYWQAVNGGLPNFGLGAAGEEARQQVVAQWPLLLRDDGYQLGVYGGEGILICLFDAAWSDQIQVATQTPAQLDRLEDCLEVEWDVLESEEPSDANDDEEE